MMKGPIGEAVLHLFDLAHHLRNIPVPPPVYTPTMNKDQIIEKVAGIFAKEDASIVFAYLFGSVARVEQHGQSDKDVAVLFDPPPAYTFLGPAAKLQDALETGLSHPVDLVVLNRAGPDLIHRLLRDGILVCERDANRRVQFEVKARNDYFDLLPYLVEYRSGEQ